MDNIYWNEPRRTVHLNCLQRINIGVAVYAGWLLVFSST